MNGLIAGALHLLGVKPSWSTGICGASTAGYGELDHNGYWQYPLIVIRKLGNKEVNQE